MRVVLNFSRLVLSVAALAALQGRALAAPKHDICQDLTSFGVGVSSYGAAEGWPELAKQNGVSWNYLYFYVFPSQTPVADMTSFIQLKGQIAKGLGAEVVVTFYDLLKRGQSAGITARSGAANAEADIVQQTMANATQMRGYYDGYIAVLKAAASTGINAMVHVEPDSWGFMMWAMGVEGRTNASTLPTAVVSSGHPDLAGQTFPNDAGGFGRALLYLRDKYAPSVRLGWHASNFRSGSRPDVVTSFYSSMGEWDAIVTEEPHILSNEQSWWLPLDTAAVDANVAWVSAVSSAAKVPVLLWQVLIGSFDYHLLAETGGRAVLTRFAQAGLAGVMWEHQGSGATPDAFRGIGVATPPSGSAAGGTAKDLRDRLAAFQKTPLAWPANSICANSGAGGAGGSDGGATSAGAGGNSAAGDASTGGASTSTGGSGTARGGSTSTGGNTSTAGSTSSGGVRAGTGGSGSATGGNGNSSGSSAGGNGNSSGSSAGGNGNSSGSSAGGNSNASGAGPGGAAPTPAKDDSGCACSAQGSSRSGPWMLVALGAAFARLRRRSRKEGQPPRSAAS